MSEVDPRRLLAMLLEEAKLTRYGTLRLEVTTVFDLIVHAGTLQGFDIVDRRMKVRPRDFSTPTDE